MKLAMAFRAFVALLSCSSFADRCAACAGIAAEEGAVDRVSEYASKVEGPQQPDRKGLDALNLEQLMGELHVPGVGIVVIRDFAIHWAKSYGLADVQSGARVDAATLFQAASISKPVTAMAVLKAAQDRKFPLDDDINTVLRSWKLPARANAQGRSITARMLASHTSGLGDGFGFPGYRPGESLPTVLQILSGRPPSNVGALSITRPPLQAMRYSGGGYLVLQLAITEALGRPFPVILEEDVLRPIGMRNSVFEQPLSAGRERNAARGHDGKGKALDARWHVYPELAAAGLWTTPLDLALFVVEIQKSVHGRSNAVLSRSTVQQMLTPVGVGDYGVGLALEKRGEGWYFQHWGSNWGYTCLIVGHKLAGYGLVVMTNSEKGKLLVGEIRDRVERVYGWDSLDKPAMR